MRKTNPSLWVAIALAIVFLVGLPTMNATQPEIHVNLGDGQVNYYASVAFRQESLTMGAVGTESVIGPRNVVSCNNTALCGATGSLHQSFGPDDSNILNVDNGNVWCFAYGPDVKRQAASLEIGAGHLGGVIGPKPVVVETEPTAAFPFFLDGKTLACCGRLGDVELWDVPTEHWLGNYQLSPPISPADLFGLTLSSDSETLAFGRADGSTEFADALEGKKIATTPRIGRSRCRVIRPGWQDASRGGGQ